MSQDFNPLEPTGSDGEALFAQRVLRTISRYLKFRDSSTVKWDITSQGIIAKALSRGGGSASPVGIKHISLVNQSGFQSIWGDYWWGVLSGGYVPVAKPFHLRNSILTQTFYNVKYTYTYPHNAANDALFGQYRNTTPPIPAQNEGYSPPYYSGEIVLCVQPGDSVPVNIDPANTHDPSGKSTAGMKVTWEEISGREWARFFDQTFGT